ncbi:MAG: MFS transporter [Dehalococcoidales bacterium]|nr:MFS transporter [Dehalococcoidales bacterium]
MTTDNIPKIKKSLRLSLFDGASSSVAMGLTQSYITPFALQLNATTFQIGLLTSIPNLSMALSQMIAPNLTERIGSRKGIVLPAVLIDAVMWLPMLLIPFLFKQHGFLFLMIFYTFKTVGGGLAGPAYGSLMADLAWENVRGRYFSRRLMISNACMIAMSFAAMFVMQYYQNIDKQLIGFSILFGGAFVFRLLAAYFVFGMYEPPPRAGSPKPEPVLKMIRHLNDSNLGKFIIVMSLTMFTTNMSGPFFGVYLLRDLKFDYIPYIIITSASGIFSILFQPFWGRRADKSGNVIIIKIATFLMPLVPISWVFSSNIYYLIASQAITAFVWSGMNLASSNFIYDAAKPEHRTQHLAIYNMFVGVAACGGSLLGGFLASHLPPLLGYPLRTLFLVAGLVRIVVVMVGFRQITEVRQVPKVSLMNFFRGKFPKLAAGEPETKDYGFHLMPDFKDEELVDKPEEKQD